MGFLDMAEVYRPYLTLLIWGLLCEIILLAYFVANNNYGAGFYLTLILLPITLGGIIVAVKTIRKKLLEEK